MPRSNSNGVDEMLDMLYEMIDDAKAIPFSEDCRLNRNDALDLMDSIREHFPVELNESVKIVKSRDQILSDAQRESKRIIDQAQSQAQRLVDDTEIVRKSRAAAEEAVRTAKARANELLNDADEKARETTQAAEERAESLKRSANEYCADALRRTEDAVGKAYDEVKDAYDHFNALVSENTGGTRKNEAYDAEKDE